MPRIEVSRRDLAGLAGMELADDRALEGLLDTLKAELKASDGDVLKIELNDTNRPDLWCAEGIARGLRSIASGRGRRYLQGLPEPSRRLEVDGSVERIRPWIAAFASRGPAVTGGMLASLVGTQEKLAASFGRNRKTAAIGFYRLAEISFPVTYSAVSPATRIHPLGEPAPMTLDEVLRSTETGRKYAHLLAGLDRYPFLADSAGAPLSFPPVLNSETTGRVEEGDTDLFCEVTGTDWHTVQLALSILACNLEDRGAAIEPVEVVYAAGSPCGGSVATPLRFADSLRVTWGGIESVLGRVPSGDEIDRALGRMGCDSWASDADGLSAVLPPYRHDGIHPVDLIEEIAIGSGLDSFEALLPGDFTLGGSAHVEDLADAARILMAGMGFEEVLLPVLGPPVDRAGNPVPGRVAIANPMTSEYGSVRGSLLEGLVGVEAASTHAPYPHRVFEVGEVLETGDDGILRTALRLAGAVFGNEAPFGEAHSALGVVCSQRGLDLELVPSADPRFLAGRCASVLISGRPAGVLGEIAPGVLESSGASRPGSAFEIGLDALEG
jgi:phenylalanyl-tRNA synthetase beta chain